MGRKLGLLEVEFLRDYDVFLTCLASLPYPINPTHVRWVKSFCKFSSPQILMKQKCFAHLTHNDDWNCPWGTCNFEGKHGGPHIWLGGQMGTFCSPMDPIFWLHHSFIDKMWEDFRQGAQVRFYFDCHYISLVHSFLFLCSGLIKKFNLCLKQFLNVISSVLKLVFHQNNLRIFETSMILLIIE